MADQYKPIYVAGNLFCYQRVSDGRSIPLNAPNNSDWQLFDAERTATPSVVLTPDPAPLTFSTNAPLLGRITTSDALGQSREIFRGTLAPATGYIATLDIIAVQAVTPFDRTVIRASASAARIANGAILDGQAHIHPPFRTAGAAADVVSANTVWGAVASVAGNDFIITVTGRTGKTINWSLRGDFYSFTPGGS